MVNSFQMTMEPEEYLAMHDNRVLFRERLIYRQDIPTKTDEYASVQLYKICGTNEYTNVLMYKFMVIKVKLIEKEWDTELCLI